MPTPQFVLDLRQKVGHDLLWLSTAMGAVLDVDGRVLLGRRADVGVWTLPGGIIDPAEQPADAAIREVFEETGVLAMPEMLTSVGVSPAITYANGDQVQYLEYCFRCRAVGGEARVNDGELSEVGWHSVADLPVLGGPTRRLLATALAAQTADFTFSGLAEVLGQSG
ncbi:MAG TPA: NUDIX domain-containing protein [Streptosporangiaceae bacterium]|nr:NUDIX domain-containing protein [Streptosporangiaceae bacterium]